MKRTEELDTVNGNWIAWRLSGQVPGQIGWLPSALGSADPAGTPMAKF